MAIVKKKDYRLKKNKSNSFMEYLIIFAIK